MALDKDRLGAALWARVKSENGPYTPPMAGAQEAQGLKFWKGIAGELINEIKNNGDIDLASADVSILPGTFKDSLSAPITGLGINQAVVLSGKIK